MSETTMVDPEKELTLAPGYTAREIEHYEADTLALLANGDRAEFIHAAAKDRLTIVKQRLSDQIRTAKDAADESLSDGYRDKLADYLALHFVDRMMPFISATRTDNKAPESILIPVSDDFGLGVRNVERTLFHISHATADALGSGHCNIPQLGYENFIKRIADSPEASPQEAGLLRQIAGCLVSAVTLGRIQMNESPDPDKKFAIGYAGAMVLEASVIGELPNPNIVILHMRQEIS